MKRKKIFLGVIVIMTACLACGCKNDNDKNVNIKKGMNLIEESDYAGALDSFEAAMVYHEDEQLLYRGEGIAYMGLKNYDDAIDSFIKSLTYAKGKATPLEYDTNYYLAAAYYKVENYEKAREVYSAILENKKDEADAYFGRACSLLNEGYYDTAVADFENCFSLKPGNLDVVIDSYKQMSHCGYEEEGKVFVQNFMDKNGKSLNDADKGTLFYYLDNLEDARLYLEAALAKGNSEVSLLLGRTYQQLGDMNYASVIYKSYLDNNDPTPEIYNSLGICYMEQKKYSEALECFQSGIDIGDSTGVDKLMFNKIVACEYLGKFTMAKELMQQYIVDYPDDNLAKREYEFLKSR